MTKRIACKWWVGGMLSAALVFSLFCLAVGQDAIKGQPGPSDAILLSISRVGTPDEMPPAFFSHDLHTEALTDKECATCHVKKGEKIVFAFKSADIPEYEKQLALFHDNCIGCHQERNTADLATGPASGECRACHSEKKRVSGWTPITFGRPLHYRHEQNQTIKARSSEETANCSACHHIYDDALQKTVYEKNTEGSCGYCHLPEKTSVNDPARPIKAAAHDACVTCHLDFSQARQTTGPTTCGGCHDAGKRATYEMPKDIPRLNRGQPEGAIMAARLLDIKQGDTAKNPPAMPVAFNHSGHEQTSESCQTCHHAAIQKCSDCHTPNGDEKGGFVRLERAMHGANSDTSCIGCHTRKQENRDCGGCHELMPAKNFEQRACGSCHNISRELADGIKSDNSDVHNQMVLSLIKFDGDPAGPPPDDNIPETVSIGHIVNEYQAVTFPHRKIVKALFDRIRENRMATVFHSDGNTLCKGCHHNGPVEPSPPACASCHGASDPPAGEGMSGRPGLKGAFHGQCISCHQTMEIKTPAATACIECHPKRG